MKHIRPEYIKNLLWEKRIAEKKYISFETVVWVYENYVLPEMPIRVIIFNGYDSPKTIQGYITKRGDWAFDFNPLDKTDWKHVDVPLTYKGYGTRWIADALYKDGIHGPALTKATVLFEQFIEELSEYED